MSFWAILLLALGLALDAMAVAALAVGITLPTLGAPPCRRSRSASPQRC